MQASKVPVKGTDLNIIIQGFKGGDEVSPYVFLGVADDQSFVDLDWEITPENAHILSEEIRKHAEWASHPAGQGE